jgi:hypothetical protein
MASPGRLISLLAGIASITTRGLSAHAYLHSDEISCRGNRAMSSVLDEFASNVERHRRELLVH